MKNSFAILLTLIMICMVCTPIFVFADKEGDIAEAIHMTELADEYMENENYEDAAYYYFAAGSYYMPYLDEYSNEAARLFGLAAELYEEQLGNHEKANLMKYYQENCSNYNNSGTILSGGNLTIVICATSAVIFGFLGFLLGKKWSRT